MAKKVLVYQIYMITWESIQQVKWQLQEIKNLGATHVWVSALLESPRADHGYDISDYRRIDPRFGTMDDFDDFVKEAHRLGLKVLIDLVLNHTSTSHAWFDKHPEYYFWSEEDKPGWHNLFDNGSAWKLDRRRGKYYCHLFHEEQADLAWFDNKNHINKALVREFQDIVGFWTKFHGVDGFRLDVPQSINKDTRMTSLDFGSLLGGDKAIDVINAVFPDRKNAPFLIMELFDPSWGKLVERYTFETPVKYCMNILVKQQIRLGWLPFYDALRKSCVVPGFMLDLESHDSPRFTSESGMLGRQIAAILFLGGRAPEAACIFQGQELGLKNPSSKVLPDKAMLALDAEALLKYKKKIYTLEELRKTARSNARVPIPCDEYKKQKRDACSSLSMYIMYIHEWKKS